MVLRVCLDSGHQADKGCVTVAPALTASGFHAHGEATTQQACAGARAKVATFVLRKDLCLHGPASPSRRRLQFYVHGSLENRRCATSPTAVHPCSRSMTFNPNPDSNASDLAPPKLAALVETQLLLTADLHVFLVGMPAIRRHIAHVQARRDYRAGARGGTRCRGCNNPPPAAPRGRWIDAC